MSSLTPLLEAAQLDDTQSGSSIFTCDGINTELDRIAIDLQKYHASHKTAITGILNKIHARVSRGELSTPFRQVVPNAPDYFSHSDFVTAYRHESLLQKLDQWPKSKVELYFDALNQKERLELRKKALKTRQYWVRHPDLRVHYFPTAGSSFGIYNGCPSSLRKAQTTTGTTKLPNLAESKSQDQDVKFCKSLEAGPVASYKDFLDAGVYYNSYDPDMPIHAPKPYRQQNIAVDLEKLIERSPAYSPTAFANHGAFGRTWTRQDSYRYQQQPRQNTLLAQQRQNPAPGLHRQIPRQIYIPKYHRQYQQRYMQDQPASYYQYPCQPQAPPWHQVRQIQRTYPHEYHGRYQEWHAQQPQSSNHQQIPQAPPPLRGHQIQRNYPPEYHRRHQEWCLQLPRSPNSQQTPRPPKTPVLHPVQLHYPWGGGDLGD